MGLEANTLNSSPEETKISCGKNYLRKSIMKSISKKSKKDSHLLRKGIKFSSAKEFEEYLKNEAKTCNKKKDSGNVCYVNEGFKDFTPKKTCLNSSVLQAMLKEEEDSRSVVTPTRRRDVLSPAEELKSSRFRYINEKLYTQTGSKSKEMFKKDPESFQIYHEGYSHQSHKWPVDPLDCIMSSITNKLKKGTIADMGCGDARLSRTLSSSEITIHSFDFIALNDRVTPCDMAKTPLPPLSVDITVFCLSLMGTNIKDYLREAHRILKPNGILKIAEVESRFRETTTPKFISTVNKMGFKLKWKDLSKKVFYMMDFQKQCSIKKSKIPDLTLKPCFYKKR